MVVVANTTAMAPPGRPAPHDEGPAAGPLRRRFEAQLPKYGTLWRSMARARREREARGVDKENADANRGTPPRAAVDAGPGGGGGFDRGPTSGLLDAIAHKRSVSLRVPPASAGLCGEGCCDGAAPIEEIDDEDASDWTADADRTLVDTTDDESRGEGAGAGQEEGGSGRADVASLDDDVGDDSDDDDDAADDDDESVLVIVKTPKTKRAFVIDSDDDEESSVGGDESAAGEAGDDDDSSILSDGISLMLESVQSLSDDAGRDRGESEGIDGSITLPDGISVNSTSIHSLSDSEEMTEAKKATEGDDASSSEEEWVEISSDEDEGPMRPESPPNTVVILSSDEESLGERESERGACAVADEEDDSSDGSAAATRTGRAGGSKRTGRDAPVPKTPAGKRAPRREASQPRSTAAFRRNRDALTKHTFAEFDRKVFGRALSSVEVTWSQRLNTTAGRCRMRGKPGAGHGRTRVAAIELAAKVIDDEARLRATLLHEMCHAAQWLVDGEHRPPHGRCFKKWAVLAMRKVRDVEVTTRHDYEIAYRYAWACTALGCGVVIKRHSRSIDPARQCCGQCRGRLVEIEVPGSRGDASATGHTAKKVRKASHFALFVKERSADVRKELEGAREGSVSQAEVMKECGRLWRSRKGGAEGEKDGLGSMAERLTALTLCGETSRYE